MKTIYSALLFAAFLLAASFFAANMSHAASVLVDQEPPGTQVQSLDYRIRPSSGRAWIVLHLAGAPDRILRVPALSFDTGAELIVFNAPSGQVICAEVFGIPGTPRIIPTGYCSFHAQGHVPSAGDHPVPGAPVEGGALNVYFDVAE